ncbi:MAG: hypothetical protein AB1Z98_38270 [Nannocystaceae bacterium]
MTSISTRLRAIGAGAAVVGLLTLPACDDGDGDSGDTQSMATQGSETGTPAETETGTPMEDSTGTPGETPSHATDIQPIWDEHCVTACHEPGGTGEFWLDLSPGTAYGAIVDVAALTVADLDFVEPGDVETSFLWHKINNTQASVGGGGVAMPMPRVGEEVTVITPAQYDLIEAWIAGGAPE